MKQKTAIRIKDLSVQFDGINVLEEINLLVKAKEFLGIIGPNGGGKTTLLKTILGLIKPSKGKIEIFNEPPIIGRKHLGYVPQYTRYDKDFPISVWEVVLMGRLSHRGYIPWYSKVDKTAARTALESVEMYEFKSRHID